MKPHTLFTVIAFSCLLWGPAASASAPEVSVRVLRAGKVAVESTAAISELVHETGSGLTLDGYTTSEDGMTNHFQFIIAGPSGRLHVDIEAPAQTCMQRTIDADHQIAIRACAAE